MAAPGGAAQRLTARPFAGLAISGGIAVGSTWIGVVLSYLIPSLPPSSAILGVATLAYVASALVVRAQSGRAEHRSRSAEGSTGRLGVERS
jgi:zinc/manganese transport system permease protein